MKLTLNTIAKESGKTKELIIQKFVELGIIVNELEITNKGVSMNCKIDFYMGNKFIVFSDESYKVLIDSFNKKEEIKNAEVPVENKKEDFRTKFQAEIRTNDGHFVRSRAEAIIDNWLFQEEVVHAYEKKLPVEEEIYCDFYLPKGRVYIEFWGLENNPEYVERKKKKLEIYKKYNMNLIEVRDGDLNNIDDFLPRALLKFGITIL